jgi:glycosyltransferase involved in cell wall biosynthesis
MKILHLVATLSPQQGGPSKVVPAMCSALVSRGHQAEIVTTNWNGRGEFYGSPLEENVATYHKAVWPQSYGTSWSLAADVRRRIANFDVVHVHQVYFFHGLIARVFCTRKQIPYVISPHGVFDPFHRNVHSLKKACYTALIERSNTSKASAFHYASIAERDHAVAAGIPDRSFVVPLAVDISPEHDVEPLLRLHPELIGKTLVTFLGRLTAKKRLDLVVDAFARAAAVDSDIHLVIAGPDSEGIGEIARSQIEALGLNARASFLGVLTGRAKEALLVGSRMLVLPSENESFGLVVVEAMAAGVPVVISEDVAVHREVAAGEAGFVVPRDAVLITKAICTLLSPDIYQRMSMNARSVAVKTFGMSQMAVGLEKMYRQVIKGGPLRGSMGHE